MSQELGTLVVVVLKARNLIDKHSFYKQDVFAQVSLNDTVKKTPVDVKGGQHPFWDSELRFAVLKAESNKSRNIEVSCFAKEHRSDDLLGKGTVDITKTIQAGEFDDWVSLNIDGVVRGEVYLEMTYFSSASVPPTSQLDGQDISRRPSRLAPSKRLYRPHQCDSQHTVQADNHASKSASPAGQSLPTPYSTGGDLALSLPEKSQLLPVPGILKPGGASRPHQAPRNPTNSGHPSVLRPGNGKSPTSNPARIGTPPGPCRQPPFNEFSPLNEFSAANPYLSALPAAPSFIPAVPPVRNVIVPLADYSFPADIAASPVWDRSDLATPSLSFPEPVIPIAPQFHVQAESYQDIRCQQAAQAKFSSPVDRYFSPRYQVPLPLPQDMDADITSSSPDSRPPETNLEAHREAEEDSAERHGQEQGDLALALKLDLELNS